jgi:hypothetical protein
MGPSTDLLISQRVPIQILIWVLPCGILGLLVAQHHVPKAQSRNAERSSSGLVHAALTTGSM